MAFERNPQPIELKKRIEPTHRPWRSFMLGAQHGWSGRDFHQWENGWLVTYHGARDLPNDEFEQHLKTCLATWE